MNSKTHLIKGVTLLEMVFVIVLLGIIGGMSAVILHQQFASGYSASSLLERTWQARLVLQRIVHDLIYMEGITTATSNVLAFNDQDNIPVIYTHTTSNYLQRNGYDVAGDVTNLEFKYMDSNYDLYSSLPIADIKCVYVTATVTKENASLPLQTIICPRNL